MAFDVDDGRRETRKSLDKIHAKLDAHLAAANGTTDNKVDDVADKLDNISNKLDAIDKKLDAVCGKLDAVCGKLDAICDRLDTACGNLEDTSSRLVKSLDDFSAGFNRLVDEVSGLRQELCTTMGSAKR